MNVLFFSIETGNNSTVSEIEPPEIIVPVTVSPEITHEEFVNRFDGSVTSEANEIDVAPNPQIISVTAAPEIPEQESHNQNEELPEQGSSQPEKQKKRRRKGKVTELQEDNSIDADFASSLDMSCIEGTTAPAINDAYIQEYIQYDLNNFFFSNSN